MNAGRSECEVASNTQNYRIYGLCLSPGIVNNQKTQRFGNWICFRLQVIEGDAYSIRSNRISILVLSKRTNRAGVSIPSLEAGNRCRLRNIVFSSHLEVRRMDEVQNPSYSFLPFLGHHKMS
jgi:hypothetical protein